MTQTEHYKLNQWDASDRVRHDDFNEDNRKLDEALKEAADARAALAGRVDGKADASALSDLQSKVSSLQTAVAGKQDASGAVKFASGTYTGNGAETRKISLSFTPKAVLVFPRDGYTYDYVSGYYMGGLATTNLPAIGPNNENMVRVVDGGFSVCYKKENRYTILTNAQSWTFNYIALG